MSFSSLLPRRARVRPRPALFVGLILAAVSVVPFVAYGMTQSDPAARSAARSAKTGAGAAEFVLGRVLVRFRSESEAKSVGTVSAESTSDGRALALAAPNGEQISARVESFAGAEIVSGLRIAYVAPEQTLAAIDALNARADVLYAEPDYVRHILLTPNDPRFTSGELYGLQKIAAPSAWNINTGSSSVVVGIIDQGVQVAHPDLVDNIWRNPGETGTDAQGHDKASNGIDDDGDGFIDDVNGWDFVHNDKTVFDSATGDFHATHVAGTIGARGNNGTGVVGVNWQVSMMSLKVLDDNAAVSGTTSMLLGAYNYALMMKQRGVNLRALNNSYGGAGSSQSELLAIRALSDAGILFVAAAGNDARDNFSVSDFPANYDSPNVIAVASTDSSDNLSGFSNFSSRLVSIGAPGDGIVSTYPLNAYKTLSGTSMATPHVTGAAALVVAAKPDITMQQLRGVLAFAGDPVASLQGTTTTGRRLNVFNSVQRALENDTTTPATPTLNVGSQTGRTVTLQWTAPGDDGNSGQAADYDFFFVNPSTGLRVLLPTVLFPATAGTFQNVTVSVPYLNFSGNIEMRTYDDTGNFSTASIPVNVSQSTGSDPYVVTESAAQPVSTDTATRLALDGDDRYYPAPTLIGGVYTFPGYTLPFAFPFYGQNRSKVTVSTNGVLYFSNPGVRDNGDADDVPSSVDGMQGQALIAGLWDDLMIDQTVRADSGVYVVQPDASRIIFRWQGVTFDTHAPVNFEVELRSDGTIITRYGNNPDVYPVVGVSAGEPTAYVVSSHTREFDGSSPSISLTSASTVTFAPRTNSASSLQFSASAYTVSEAAGSATITVKRVGGSSGAVSIDYATSNGTASAGSDYTATSGTLNFADGETSKTFVVPITNDALDEDDENLNVTLSNPSVNASLGSPITATLTIIDDDPTPGVSVNDVSLFEGNSGTTNAVFTVTLSQPSGRFVSVNYSTANGTATAGSDYTPAAGTLIFNAGETSKQVAVAVIGDTAVEPDETFTLNLSGATNVTISKVQGTATIKNDDAVSGGGATIQFSTSTFGDASEDDTESAPHATIIVTRTGDTSGSASVSYRTVDDPAAVRCDVANGTAYARCDYATVVGTLTFAPGETQKTFTVPIIDDTFVEGPETFSVALSNPTGATLGSVSTATVVIADNDPFPTSNPLSDTKFFVRQQYLDFLSREPDAAGMTAWVNTINNCAAGDTTCDRVSVSANFFRSQEFQLKGLFVFRFYKVAFGRMPLYSEIVADMAAVTGNSTPDLIARKAAFTEAFAQRQEFVTDFGAAGNQLFVDTLMNRYSLQSITTINPSSPDDSQSPRITLTRTDLVSRLNAGTMTRGQVIRALADSNEVSAAEFNPAFVAMQYFGYLRRDPDQGGYNDWLRTINANPSDVRSMVNGFVNSIEYRLRFGPQ